MKAVTYLYQGTIPDIRGNAPALVAENFIRHFNFFTPATICDAEHYPQGLEAHPEYGEIYRIGYGRLYRRLFKKLTRLDPYPLHQRAARLVNRLGPAVFHVHQLEFPLDEFRNQLYDHTLPIFSHIHVFQRFQESLGMPERFIAVSEYARKRSIAEFGYPAHKVEVLHNGVDTARFVPPEKAEQAFLHDILGIPADATVLGYVGRKVSDKGYLGFLECALRSLKEHRHVYAVAVGMKPREFRDDPQRERILQLERELAEDGRFRNFPAVPQSRLPAFYKVIDVLLFPTYFGSETFGLVSVEAQAAGCIVIASDYAALPEIIRDGENGFLVAEPKNFAALHDKCDYVVTNLAKLGEVRHAARSNAVQRFDWKLLAARLEKLYLEAVE
ncbi:MAG: glycosyltransferase family 4 protein [Sulfuricella sp.]|nr:glycosyltransferase family 4 protein [Sulfuricella sp.]